MADQHDFDRALRALYQDAPDLPADALREALDESATVRQRRFGPLPVLRPGRPGLGMALLGPAAAVLLLIVGGVLLASLLTTRPESEVGPPVATASPETTVSPAPSPAGSSIVVAQDGSGDAATLAEALGLAKDGDTIRIRPGTYVGGVTVTEDLTIAGDGPPGEVVVIATGETPTVELDDTFAYAFLTQDADATIRDLTLRNAGALRFAPIVAAGGAPTLQGLDAGGTIWLVDGSDATVRANRIAGISMSGELGDPSIEENITTDARSVVEQTLGERLPSLACQPWREEDEPFSFGSIGAVRCPEPEAGVTQLALFAFPDAATLERYWHWRLEDLGLDLDAGGTAQACDGGRYGVRPWEHGLVACYASTVADGAARIRWTDVRDLTYGVIDGTDEDLGEALRYWNDRMPP